MAIGLVRIMRHEVTDTPGSVVLTVNITSDDGVDVEVQQVISVASLTIANLKTAALSILRANNSQVASTSSIFVLGAIS